MYYSHWIGPKTPSPWLNLDLNASRVNPTKEPTFTAILKWKYQRIANNNHPVKRKKQKLTTSWRNWKNWVEMYNTEDQHQSLSTILQISQRGSHSAQYKTQDTQYSTKWKVEGKKKNEVKTRAMKKMETTRNKRHWRRWQYLERL